MGLYSYQKLNVTNTTKDNTSAEPTLHSHVYNAVMGYLRNIEGVPAANLHTILQEEVEEPLLRAVLTYVHGNRSKASIILGLSRGTLRKKMEKFGLKEFGEE